MASRRLRVSRARARRRVARVAPSRDRSRPSRGRATIAGCGKTLGLVLGIEGVPHGSTDPRTSAPNWGAVDCSANNEKAKHRTERQEVSTPPDESKHDHRLSVRTTLLLDARKHREDVCPVCGGELVAAESRNCGSFYWRCLIPDCYTRSLRQARARDGLLPCASWGGPVEFRQMPSGPHWRCITHDTDNGSSPLTETAANAGHGGVGGFSVVARHRSNATVRQLFVL